MFTEGRRFGGKTSATGRSVAVLLVETLRWTHRDAAEYPGLDGSNAVSYHLITAAESRSPQDALDAVRNFFPSECVRISTDSATAFGL